MVAESRSVNRRFVALNLRAQTRHTAKICVGTATCIATLLPYAHAGEEDSTTKSDQVQEVVVTAQFRAERLQDTPISITTVTAAALENRGQSSVDQIAAEAPNVTLRPGANTFGNGMTASIRGVGQFDSSPALEPGVGMYVDDVYYPSLTGANFSLLDLDRVEVLRGPQGTLSGKNSIGGAVKLYSQKPEGHGGYIEVTYGGYRRTDVRAAGDFTLVPDHLFVRISGVSRSQDGYVDRVDYACAHPGTVYPDTGVPLPSLQTSGGCKLGGEGGKAYTGGRAALRWLASDALEFNLALDVVNDNSQRQPDVLLQYVPTSAAEDTLIRVLNSPDGNPAHGFTPSKFIPSNPYTSYTSLYIPGGTYQSVPVFPPYNKSPFVAPDEASYHGRGASFTADWNITESLSLKSISAYRDYNSISSFKDDGTPLIIGMGVLNFQHHHWTQELRLNGSAFNKAIDYTVGGFYLDQQTIMSQRSDLSYSLPEFAFQARDTLPAHTKAGFLHGVWHATDRLNLALGYRYTQEDKDLSYKRFSPDSAPPPWTLDVLGLTPLNSQVGTYAGSRSDYRASLDYRWTPNFMTYAQFSTGFKGGGVNPRPVTANQVRPFRAETLQAYEIGAKSELWDRRVRLNAALFYSKYKDIQLTLLGCPQLGDPPGTPCFLPANAGDADVKGAEVEIEARPFRGLILDASASYLNFEYTHIDPMARFGPPDPVTGVAPEIGITPGMISPYTPRHKGSVGVQYEIPLGESGSIAPRVDAEYTSEYFSNAVNSVYNEVHGYALMNGHLLWFSPGEIWQASFEVSNLTNRLYYYSKLDFTAQYGTTIGQVGMPRTWSLTLKRNFN